MMFRPDNIQKIEFKTRHLVERGIAGAYHSAFKGHGVTFASVRPYLPGDDVRTIDWNITARMGDPYVKEFVEDRELTVMLLMDMSGSFQVSASTPSRREYAAELGALLAMSATLNQDRVGLIGFTRNLEYLAPPKRGRNHVLRLLHALFSFKAIDKGTDLASALQHLRSVLKQRSLVFIISDFLTSHSDWVNALQMINHRHDVIAICIREAMEYQLPKCGLISIRDAEQNRQYVIDTDSSSIRESFANGSQENLNQLKSTFLEIGID